MNAKGRKWGFRSLSKSARKLHILTEETLGVTLTSEGKLGTVFLKLEHVLEGLFNTGCWTPPSDFLSDWVVLVGAQEFAFLTVFQVLLLLLAQALYSENPCGTYKYCRTRSDGICLYFGS